MPGPQPWVWPSPGLSKDVKVLETMGLPPTLDPVYQEDPHERRQDLLPPPLTDPLFIPSMARVVFEAVRPPVVLQALPLASNHVAVPAPVGLKGKDSGPGTLKPEEHTPSTSQPSLRAPEQGSIASDTDYSPTKEIISEEVPFPRSLKVRLPLGLLKRSH